MYSQDKIDTALKIYHQCGSVTKTVRVLGYPTKRALYKWIANEEKIKMERKPLELINTVEHPRNPSIEVKMSAIYRCFESGENVNSVSEDIGYSRASIYQWRKRYLKEGTIGLMNNKNITPGRLIAGTPSAEASSNEIKQLKEQMQEMQLEIDILKETINVLKKDLGIDQSALSNREKAVIIDALKNRYSLPLLLKKMYISKSSYYYQERALNQDDKYTDLRIQIRNLFDENKKRYGYRRIHALLKRKGITVSEKIIRRIMKDEGLVVKVKRTGKYSSYKGGNNSSGSNVINREIFSIISQTKNG